MIYDRDPRSDGLKRCFSLITASGSSASQLKMLPSHEQIGDPTLADGILDRLVHNAHRIEMRGDSMRGKKSEKEEK